MNIPDAMNLLRNDFYTNVDQLINLPVVYPNAPEIESTCGYVVFKIMADYATTASISTNTKRHSRHYFDLVVEILVPTGTGTNVVDELSNTIYNRYRATTIEETLVFRTGLMFDAGVDNGLWKKKLILPFYFDQFED